MTTALIVSKKAFSFVAADTRLSTKKIDGSLHSNDGPEPYEDRDGDGNLIFTIPYRMRKIGVWGRCWYAGLGAIHTTEGMRPLLSDFNSDTNDAAVRMFREKHSEIFAYHRKYGLDTRGEQLGSLVLAVMNQGVYQYETSVSVECFDHRFSHIALNIPDAIPEQENLTLKEGFHGLIGQHTVVEKHILASAKVIAACHRIDPGTGPIMQAGFTIQDGGTGWRMGYFEGRADAVEKWTAAAIREEIEWWDQEKSPLILGRW